jgi:aspartyl-tRNA synthetase
VGNIDISTNYKSDYIISYARINHIMQRTLTRDLHEYIGKEVLLKGWVDSRRDHGKLIFLDLRDFTGKVQMVVLPEARDAQEVGTTLRDEWVIEVKGKVNARPKKMVNENERNGNIEIEVLEIIVLNESKTPPFELKDTSDVEEVTRLKYRYLDLRSSRMQKNMRKRGEITKFIRDYLIEKENFVEIETPILTKPTPEGARDFLVPSRKHHGKFYGLPQSPQQYKQLLMVAGFERYFQFAKCFRDEDSRADRAYGEFTQLDLEISFVKQEDIISLTEKMFTEMIKTIFPEKKFSEEPWPRLNYEDSMKKYGSDKPDLRKDKSDPNEMAFAWVINFPLFTEQSEDDFYHGSGSASFAPSHHMFTAPHPDDIALLDSDPTKARGLQHDLVLNGFEVGGGSIRIHDRKVQEKVFDLIGFSEEQKQKFAHMLDAFTFGVPPHGGIAPGLDRLVMAILGEPSLREVMAFPATGTGQISVMDAPSPATKEQLNELGIEIKTNGKE